MAKKKIIRRVPATPPAKLKKKPKGYTEIAWLREHGEFAECSCGKLRVEIFETDAVITGQHGWVREGQWMTCGVKGAGEGSGCLESIRFSPRLVWQTASGARYTTNVFLKEGEQNRRLDDGA